MAVSVVRHCRPCSWHMGLALAMALAVCEAPAQVGVSESGQAVYTVPIPAPPGIAGHEPKLSLQYARGASGHVAAGWTIAGGSLITRCGSTRATDGIIKGVRYTSEDRFCLDGERLIETDADGKVVAGQPRYGHSGSEYRTEKDAFTRIRAYGGSPASGPERFKAWTKSGLVYEYGYTVDSRIVAHGWAHEPIATWAVSTIRDAASNFIQFSYRNQHSLFAGTGGREWWLWQVRYTGNENLNQAPANRIEFFYEPGRPDVSESYHEGSKTIVGQRLVHVSTFIRTTSGDREINRLNLAYTVSPNTRRSLLASVQLCGGTGMLECAPSTAFTYTPGPDATFAAVSLSELTLARKAGNSVARGVYQGDFNGDGREDLLVWDDDAASSAMHLSNGDGTFSNLGQPFPHPIRIGHSNGCYYAVVADFNLDSIADVLQVQEPDARPGCASLERASRIYVGQASGYFKAPVDVTRETGGILPLLRVDPRWFCQHTEQSCEAVGTFGGRNYSLVDLNGDGWLDLLFTRTPPHGSDTFTTHCAPAELTCIYLGGPILGRFAMLPTNLGSKDLFSMGGIYALQGLPGYQSDRLHIGDLNGDGLADMVVRDTGKVYIATGNGGEYRERQLPAPCAAGSEILDINGDGKWDVACMDFSSSEPFRAYVNDGSGNFIYRSDVSDWKGNCSQLVTSAGYEPVGCDPWTRAWVNFIAADIDGDGISDVMSISRRLRRDPPRYNSFLRGRADGSYVPFSIPTLEQEPLAFGESQMLIGDFSGKGALEILSYSPFSSWNRLYKRADAVPADLLRTVSVAGNSPTTIHYRPLSDPSVYRRAFTATYPNIDHIGSTWVVSAVDRPNGRGGFITTQHEYQHQVNDISGRGSLGFRFIVKKSPGPDGTQLTQQTTNYQPYPFTGLTQASHLFRTALGAESWTTLVESEYRNFCEQSTLPKVHRLAPSYMRERTRDAAGTYIGWVETYSVSHNCFGDPAVVEVQTRKDPWASDVSTKRTESTFTADTSGDKWMLGRLQSANQINTIPVAAFPAPSPPIGSTPNNPPSLSVSMTPVNDRLYVGKPSVRRWTTSNVTSLRVSCIALGSSGYEESSNKNPNGSDTLTGNAAWLNGGESHCTWTAQGPGGVKTVTHTFRTVHPPPTLSVQLLTNPLVAGQPYAVQWTSSDATSVSYSCSAVTAGAYSGGGTVATPSGTMTSVVDASWAGTTSRCTWIATGAGGTTTASYDMRPAPFPAISATVTPNPLLVGSSGALAWSAQETSSVDYTCTAGGSGFRQSGTVGTSGSLALSPQSGWVGYPTTCTWTAKGPGGSRQFQQTFSTVHAIPTVSAAMPTLGMTQTPMQITVASTNATQVSAQCQGGIGVRTLAAPTVNGTFVFQPDNLWEGNLTCVWTATGPGGSATSAPMGILIVPNRPPDAGP